MLANAVIDTNASGIGAHALMAGVLPEWLIVTTGSVLLLFSVFCFGAAGSGRGEKVSVPKIWCPRLAPSTS